MEYAADRLSSVVLNQRCLQLVEQIVRLWNISRAQHFEDVYFIDRINMFEQRREVHPFVCNVSMLMADVDDIRL